jgi:hypothetical protein
MIGIGQEYINDRYSGSLARVDIRRSHGRNHFRRRRERWHVLLSPTCNLELAESRAQEEWRAVKVEDKQGSAQKPTDATSAAQEMRDPE